MKNMNITDLLNANMEDYEGNLSNAIHSVPGFNEVDDKFNGHLRKIKDIYPEWQDLDDCIASLEVIHKDTSFSEGFKMGVQLMVSSLK